MYLVKEKWIFIAHTHVGADTLDCENMMRNWTEETSHKVTACDVFMFERVRWIPVDTLNACMHRI